jgi:chemotaxis protein methyltransferase CheR
MDSLVNYVSDIIARESGNVLGANQKSMVINRLKKRLLDLGCNSAEEYFNHLEKNYDREVTHLISLLTTHHTFFFREFCHFEYIVQNLESIIAKVKKRNDDTIRILSAACSRGQEVYSLSMLLNYHLKNYPGIKYEILGTDIDPASIKIAKNGVYPYSEVKSIPQIYLSSNWQRGTGDISKYAKVKKHIKDKCSFDVMNLLRPQDSVAGRRFDLILCRNVFIYFELSDVEKIVKDFKQYLYPNALFITGLSESLQSLSIEKKSLAPSVYCFDMPVKDEVKIRSIKAPALVLPSIPKPIKILAVDDSTSVLKLLTKIFTSDPDFELVGTASNGIEAKEFLKTKTVDAMTLDIHMPQMDGVEYLKENFRSGHPNVVVVSSASREDTRYAQQTLKYGACDFVEKPALNNLKQRADEIKNKIKMSFLNDSSDRIPRVDLDFSNDFKIEDINSKARFFVGSFSDKKKIKATVDSLKGGQPPTFVFFEGNSNFLEVIKQEFVGNVKVYEEGEDIKSNYIYLCDFKNDFEKIGKKFGWKKVSLSIFGIISKSLEEMLLTFEIGQVLIEDNESINSELREIATDIFPWTSFSHVATEFLAKLK